MPEKRMGVKYNQLQMYNLSFGMKKNYANV